MGLKLMSQKELQALIDSGVAKKVTLGAVETALKPRGLMDHLGGYGGIPFAKDSLARMIAEQLRDKFQFYTDPEFANAPGGTEARESLIAQLEEATREVIAWARTDLHR